MSKYQLTDFLTWLEENDKKNDQFTTKEWEEFARIEKYGKLFTNLCQFSTGEITIEKFKENTSPYEDEIRNEPFSKGFFLPET